MSSDLRHSIPDTPKLTSPSLELQIGSHVVATAYCISLLSDTLLTSSSEKINISSVVFSFNLDRSLSFFRENYNVIDVLLNCEPLYVAAQITKMSESFIDQHAEKFLPIYNNLSAIMGPLSNDSLSLNEALGRYVVGHANGNASIQYEITIDGVHLDTGTL